MNALHLQKLPTFRKFRQLAIMLQGEASRGAASFAFPGRIGFDSSGSQRKRERTATSRRLTLRSNVCKDVFPELLLYLQGLQ